MILFTLILKRANFADEEGDSALTTDSEDEREPESINQDEFEENVEHLIIPEHLAAPNMSEFGCGGVLGEHSTSTVRMQGQGLLSRDGDQAESATESAPEQGPVLAMPIPVRPIPNDLGTTAEVHVLDEVEAEAEQTSLPTRADIGEDPTDFDSPISPNNSALDRLDAFLENWAKENPNFSEVALAQTSASPSTGIGKSQYPARTDLWHPDSIALFQSIVDPSKLSITIPANNALRLEGVEEPVANQDHTEREFEDEEYDYFDMSDYFAGDDLDDAWANDNIKGKESSFSDVADEVATQG